MKEKFSASLLKSPKDTQNDAKNARSKAKNFMKMGEEESLRGLGKFGRKKIFYSSFRRNKNA